MEPFENMNNKYAALKKIFFLSFFFKLFIWMQPEATVWKPCRQVFVGGGGADGKKTKQEC